MPRALYCLYSIFCLWLSDQESIKKWFLPLGVATLGLGLLILAFWLGVVNTFLLRRAFFLLDTGVRGGGKAKMSTSLSWTSLFSLFSLACSRFLSLWQRGVAFRALSGVGLERCPFSTDGDTNLFKNIKRQMWCLRKKLHLGFIWTAFQIARKHPKPHPPASFRYQLENFLFIQYL